MADEMYTVKQAALYLRVSETDVRLMIRQDKLRAWAMPFERVLLVRKSDLARLRQELA